MLNRSRGFIKISTRGSVQKVVREHYLRDDIPCGITACRVCANPDSSILLEPSPKQNPSYPDPHIIIPDTNILLHHLDVLERPVFTDAVILQTVLDEVRNRNAKHYDRIRAMILQHSKRFFVLSNEHHRETFVSPVEGESDNDRNDRAIRRAASGTCNTIH